MKPEYENIKRIIASVGGYFGSSYTFEVELVSGKITFEAREGGVSEADLILQLSKRMEKILQSYSSVDW